MSLLITLLKNLSLKMTSKNLALLYNERLDDFPLFDVAFQFHRHEESMIKIAAKTITLNVLKLNDSHVLAFVLGEKRFFNSIVQDLAADVLKLAREMDSPERDIVALEDGLDGIVDVKSPMIMTKSG